MQQVLPYCYSRTHECPLMVGGDVRAAGDDESARGRPPARRLRPGTWQATAIQTSYNVNSWRALRPCACSAHRVFMRAMCFAPCMRALARPSRRWSRASTRRRARARDCMVYWANLLSLVAA
eukprot:5453223-Pyramimonas_sp.AAC.1